jgi:hypothetical protein
VGDELRQLVLVKIVLEKVRNKVYNIFELMIFFETLNGSKNHRKKFNKLIVLC